MAALQMLRLGHVIMCTHLNVEIAMVDICSENECAGAIILAC